MKAIILDYSWGDSGNVYIAKLPADIKADEVENYIENTLQFKLSNIEWLLSLSDEVRVIDADTDEQVATL